MKEYFQTYGLAKMILPALVIVLILSAIPVSAISVSGAKYLGNISPGETAVHPMTVGIGADEDPTDVLVDVMGFGQSMDKGYTTLDPAKDLSPYSARTFITLDNSTIHLEPGIKTSRQCEHYPSDECRCWREICNYLHPCPPGKRKILYDCGYCPGIDY